MQNFHLNSCYKPFWGSVNPLMYVYKQTKPLQSMTWTSRPLLGSGHPGSLSSVKLDDQIVCTTWFSTKKQGLNYWFESLHHKKLRDLGTCKNYDVVFSLEPIEGWIIIVLPSTHGKRDSNGISLLKDVTWQWTMKFSSLLWQKKGKTCVVTRHFQIHKRNDLAML